MFGGYFLAAYLINGLRVRMFMLDSDIPLAQQFAGYALVVVFIIITFLNVSRKSFLPVHRPSTGGSLRPNNSKRFHPRRRSGDAAGSGSVPGVPGRNARPVFPPFCLSHCAPPNAESLGFPGLGHSSRPIQSQVQLSRVLVCRFNRAPVTVRFCMERCGAPLRSGTGRSRTGCRLHQRRPLPGVPHLFYTWEFPRSVGN